MSSLTIRIPLASGRVVVAALVLSGCGGHGDGPDAATGPDPFTNVPAPAGGVAAFSVSPVDLETSGTITPLGNLGPPGHVLPTDHAYIYAVDFDHPPATAPHELRPVYAPATGAVDFIFHQPSGDWKIEFRATAHFFYYLDHVQLDPSLHVGDVVRAGTQIGVTNPGGAIDLGAWDENVVLSGFVNPKRYGAGTLHCVTPWHYFTEPLRSQIYARLRRLHGADPDARIDLDVPGRLAGNWYHESVGENPQESAGPSGWPRTLAFVVDYYNPSLVRVSIGGTISAPGLWTIPDDAPRPADVSVASGKVAYRLLYSGDRGQSGLMLVEMLTPSRLRVQVFEGSHAATADFDSGAQVYAR